MPGSARGPLHDPEARMIWDTLVGPFAEFAFMRRALLGCVAVAIGATPIGVFLMLRRLSLTGDAMAHAILPGAAIGYLVAGLSAGAMTLGGLVAGMTVALLAGLVTRVTPLREDTSLAAFYLISLALGVTIVSAGGQSLDLLHVLFGSVLSMDPDTLFLVCVSSTVSVLALALVFRVLVLECADPSFLRSVSRLSAPVHFVFLALVVINLVSGFHALGTLMAVGVMILPAAAARFWTPEIGPMILLATGLAVLASILGLLTSFHADLPPGPAIVLIAGGFYVLSLIVGPVGGVVATYMPRPHLRG